MRSTFSFSFLYSMKIYEVLFESYPQLLTNLIIMVTLKRYDSYIAVSSAIISLLSLLYGIADYINFTIEETDSLLLPLLFCSFDIIFRILLSAFLFFSPLKYLLFSLPLIYALIYIPLSRKKLSLTFDDAFYNACQSFVGLYGEEKDEQFGSFFLSKAIFNSLAFIFFTTALLLSHFYSVDIIFPDHQYYLPKSVYDIASITIGILWVLSTLEGILSYHFSWMPFNRFHGKMNPRFKNHPRFQNPEEGDAHEMESMA